MKLPGYISKRRYVVLFALSGSPKHLGQELWLKSCSLHPAAYVHDETSICYDCMEEGRYRTLAVRLARAAHASR